VRPAHDQTDLRRGPPGQPCDEAQWAATACVFRPTSTRHTILVMAKTVAKLELFLSTRSEMALIGEIIDGVDRVIEDLRGATIRLGGCRSFVELLAER